jgi:hypothetical protein
LQRQSFTSRRLTIVQRTIPLLPQLVATTATAMLSGLTSNVDEHEQTRGGICAAAVSISRRDRSGIFPQAYRNDNHGKLLMMAPGLMIAPSYDRSGALGFRCVNDAAN